MALIALAAGWLGYACVHSALAANKTKEGIVRRWPRLARHYRLAYNGLAILLALPLAWATVALPGEPLWRWPGLWAWFADALALAALAGIWHVSRYYDMRGFLGLSPLERPVFSLSPWHRWVRHPWYSLALVIVWSREMTPAMLVSALMITLYFIVGSRLEEKKLVALFGKAYERYRARVPALIPLPWRRLDPSEASALAAMAGRARSARLD